MEAKNDKNLITIMDVMLEEPNAYLFVSAKHTDKGTVYSYVVSDILHTEHLLAVTYQLLDVKFEETPDDLE